MRKKKWIFAGVLCFALCMTVLTPKGQSVVQAEEQPVKQGREQMRSQQLSTHGNIVYQDSGKRAEIYAADFSLLYDKAAIVSEGVFDPSGYAHVCQGETADVQMWTFDVMDEAYMDYEYEVEEKSELNELPEISGEQITVPEPEEPTETADEEATPEPDETLETTDEETVTSETEEPPETTDEETTTPETDETPEITVSGNDIEAKDDI